MIPLSTVLIDPAKHRIRIVSSRNNHTGVETIYPVPQVPHKSRHLIGLACAVIAAACVVGILAAGVSL